MNWNPQHTNIDVLTKQTHDIYVIIVSPFLWSGDTYVSYIPLSYNIE